MQRDHSLEAAQQCFLVVLFVLCSVVLSLWVVDETIDDQYFLMVPYNKKILLTV